MKMGGHKSELYTADSPQGYRVRFREYAKNWWHYEDSKGKEWVKKFDDPSSAKSFASNLITTNLILSGL
jgi:hypothetical protein